MKKFLPLLFLLLACAPVSSSLSNTSKKQLKGVNWYGASDGHLVVGGLDKNSLENIVDLIKELGFNSVRLPFSNEMLSHAEPTNDKWLAANPSLKGKTPLEVYDAVVSALTRADVLVILNNHTTTAKWCCGWDENALWFNPDFTVGKWQEDWKMMVYRYKNNPKVIGADLRNEIRQGPYGDANWGKGDAFDWHKVSEETGRKLLMINPNIQIIVEGTSFATHLEQVATLPVDIPHVVYSAHAYESKPDTRSYEEQKRDWDTRFGYLAAQHVAPLWIGEFGAGPTDDQAWFTHFVQYLNERQLDWCFWAINSGPKASGEAELWGLLTPDWQRPISDWRTALLLGK